MTTPTGQIAVSNVNTELGRSATASFNINDSAVRTLAGKSSGQITMNDLRGKSSTTTKVLTVTEGSFTQYGNSKLPYGVYGFQDYPNFGYVNIGEISASPIVNGLTVRCLCLKLDGPSRAAPDQVNFSVYIDGDHTNTRPFLRCLPQGGIWLDPSTAHILPYTGHPTPHTEIRMATPDIASWDGSGSRTVTFEY